MEISSDEDQKDSNDDESDMEEEEDSDDDESLSLEVYDESSIVERAPINLIHKRCNTYLVLRERKVNDT